MTRFCPLPESVLLFVGERMSEQPRDQDHKHEQYKSEQCRHRARPILAQPDPAQSPSGTSVSTQPGPAPSKRVGHDSRD